MDVLLFLPAQVWAVQVIFGKVTSKAGDTITCKRKLTALAI
jgi:hypothetical protein